MDAKRLGGKTSMVRNVLEPFFVYHHQHFIIKMDGQDEKLSKQKHKVANRMVSIGFYSQIVMLYCK